MKMVQVIENLPTKNDLLQLKTHLLKVLECNNEKQFFVKILRSPCDSLSSTSLSELKTLCDPLYDKYKMRKSINNANCSNLCTMLSHHTIINVSQYLNKQESLTFAMVNRELYIEERKLSEG